MSMPGYHRQEGDCPSCPEYSAMLAGNLELQMKVTKLTEAIRNHQLNCQVSTPVDNKLWQVLEDVENITNP